MDNNTLLQQQNTTNQINKMLEQASEALLCGPTCQKIKLTDELKQKYLDAQTNLETAPIQVEQSKKIIMYILRGNLIMIIC